MNVGVVGSRDWTDKEFIFKILDEVDLRSGGQDTIVSGGAIGADTFAEKYAKEKHITRLIIKPDYEHHGKIAPLLRNKVIIDYSDMLVAFWNGKSKGTLHAIIEAVKQGKKVIIYGEPK